MEIFRCAHNNVMHAKPDLRVFLKWLIARSGSVITDVIRLKQKALRVALNLTPEFSGLIFILGFITWLVVHVAFAFAVGHDAGNLPEGRRPMLVGKWIWFFTVLIGGPFLAVAYWAMHHSMLCPFVFNACNREDRQ